MDNETEVPGFDEDACALNPRKLNTFESRVLTRAGLASGSVMSVHAAAYHISGHELLHLNITKERYVFVIFLDY